MFGNIRRICITYIISLRWFCRLWCMHVLVPSAVYRDDSCVVQFLDAAVIIVAWFYSQALYVLVTCSAQCESHWRCYILWGTFIEQKWFLHMSYWYAWTCSEVYHVVEACSSLAFQMYRGKATWKACSLTSVTLKPSERPSKFTLQPDALRCTQSRSTP